MGSTAYYLCQDLDEEHLLWLLVSPLWVCCPQWGWSHWLVWSLFAAPLLCRWNLSVLGWFRWSVSLKRSSSSILSSAERNHHILNQNQDMHDWFVVWRSLAVSLGHSEVLLRLSLKIHFLVLYLGMRCLLLWLNLSALPLSVLSEE